MGLLDSFLKSSASDKTAGELAADKATSIIKSMSGKELQIDMKLPDNITLFMGASGGTGVSTLASNVAYMALNKGFKTLMIDLNIMCPIQNVFLGVADTITKDKSDLVSYLLGKNDLGSSIITDKPIHLLYASDRSLQDAIKCNDSIAIENFELLIKTCKQLYDVVIIDCPNRVDDMLCNVAMFLAESIYTVWDEGLGSVSNIERIRRDMSLSGIDAYTKVRAVLNKRTNIRYTNYPFQKLNIELIETIPFTTDVIESSLRAEIFSDKGMSSSKNSDEFVRRVNSLTDKILRIGGYVGNE